MDAKKRSVDPAARCMLERAAELGSATAWDRSDKMQPLCGFGELGLCCHVCFMGPCRIDPFGEGARVGICGADANLIVARNLARAVATGAAAHSDHGRGVVHVLRSLAEDGAASGYSVSDPGKLRTLAREVGVDATDRAVHDVAGEVASVMESQFGLQEGVLFPVQRAPERLQQKWSKAGMTPRGIDREIVELLHRTHHGVESDPVALLRGAFRTAVADGWGGSMIATDASDVLFGGPTAVRSRANLGILREDEVNILVHGHEPVLSEMIVRVCREDASLQAAREKGARGLNVAGICCTANEILMRQGMPIAGNYLHQELALLTGAVDLMVVDVQCVMPALPEVARCQHTQVVTTSEKADIPGATRVLFDPARAVETAREIVRLAVEAFGRRDPSRVRIPRESMELVAGFTNESIPYFLGGRFRSGFRPLNDAIAAGRIRGVVGLVGCNTTKIVQDAHHLMLARRLIAQDVLVVHTGCSAIASGKAGLMHPATALESAGPGLREVCEAVGIPPVLHMGSCVDNSRILNVCVSMVAEGGLGEDISELPVAAAAPEAMSEKAITIGFYAVASGIFTVFMPVPRVAGSSVVRTYLEQDVERETGGKFLFTDDVEQAAAALIDCLDQKRKVRKLSRMLHEGNGESVGDAGASRQTVVYEPPRGVVALGCGHQQNKSQGGAPDE
jgi:anaerobic carbon-monoxide dehydrogenase catalytic subunit